MGAGLQDTLPPQAAMGAWIGGPVVAGPGPGPGMGVGWERLCVLGAGPGGGIDGPSLCMAVWSLMGRQGW